MTKPQPSPARRIAALLDEVRQAKPDARDFALFDRRDELKALGAPVGLIDRGDAKALDRWSQTMAVGPKFPSPLAPSTGQGWPTGRTPSRAAAMLNTPRPQPATPRPSYPAPKQNVHLGIVEKFMADQAKKRGFDVAIRPSSFGLDHDGDGHPDADRAATAATYDLIKNYPRGEFVEMGVKVKQDRFGAPNYKYSRGISGSPFGIEPTQWDKLGFDLLNPKNWLTKDITTLHTQPAIGSTSLAPSGADLSFARERFNGADHYIFSWQDGKLRKFDKYGREVRIVHEIPNWRPR